VEAAIISPYFYVRILSEVFVGDMVLPPMVPVGRTLLIPKCHDLVNPQNYKPITCLNVIYKLWTGCLTSISPNIMNAINLSTLIRRDAPGIKMGVLTISYSLKVCATK